MSFLRIAAPQSSSELVLKNPSHNESINRYINHEINESILLYGPPGSGKSQTAAIILKERICQKLSDQTTKPSAFTIHGKQFTSTAEVESFWDWQLMSVDCGLVQIDEFDKLKPDKMLDVQCMLDRRIDTSGVLLTTNHIGRLDPAMLSRLRCLEIQCPQPSDMLERMQTYLRSQHVNLPDKSALAVLSAAGPDLRKMGEAIDDLVAQLRPKPIVPSLYARAK